MPRFSALRTSARINAPTFLCGWSKTMNRKIKILFLAANPRDTNRLSLDEEIREILKRIRGAEQGSQFAVESELALRPQELPAALMRHQPDIVHFSGHGTPDGALCLVDDATKRTQSVSAEQLVDIFRPLGREVRCVVLSACYSAAQAQAIVSCVPCVVGMSRAVRDDSATAFAAGFYEALAFGESVQTAFELGRAQMGLLTALGPGTAMTSDQQPRSLSKEKLQDEPPPDKEIPQLLLREGIDSTKLLLLARPSGSDLIEEGSKSGSADDGIYDQFLAKGGAKLWTVDGDDKFRCGSCECLLIFPKSNQEVPACPFCQEQLIRTVNGANAFVMPAGIAHSKIVKDEVRARIQEYLRSQSLAPTALSAKAQIGQPASVYIPFWIFDAVARVNYTAMREMISVTEERQTTIVNNQPVIQKKESKSKEQRPSQGSFSKVITNHTILASNSWWDKLQKKVSPHEDDVFGFDVTKLDGDAIFGFDTTKLDGFDPKDLSREAVVVYNRTPRDGFSLIQNRYLNEFRKEALRSTREEKQTSVDTGQKIEDRLTSFNVDYSDIACKMAIVPFWICRYSYEGIEYALIINRQSGEIEGSYPLDPGKVAVRWVITIAILIVIALVLSFIVRN